MTKAGSTAIQNYLTHCREELKTHGVLFPSAGFERRNPFDAERTAGHLELVRRIRDGDIQEFDEELGAADPNTVVLSAENLFLDRPDDELNALAGYFAEWEITVVVILRGQMEWLRSRYVENVMSGFNASIQVGRDLAVEAMQKGWLDYPAALDRVRRLLSASDVRLINYDVCAQQHDVVETFLNVSGIPLTNPDLARSIRANVREKQGVLVESKRRLNYLLGQWPKSARLEFEAEFRKVGQDVLKQLAVPVRTGKYSWFPLSKAVCLDISIANLKLERAYGLTFPLAELSPVKDYMYQHRDSPVGVDELVRAGFNLAATLGARVELPERSTPTLVRPALLSRGIHHVIHLLASTTVTVHVGSTDTAFMAASFSSKLPIFVPLEGDEYSDEVNDVLRSRLPSEIVCLDTPLPAAPLARAAASVLCGREIDVVVARGPRGLGHILRCSNRGLQGAVLVLIGCDGIFIGDIAARFELQVSVSDGDCVVLVPAADSINTRMQ